jgi:hypothetical protein
MKEAAIAERLHEAWAALEGARLLADNNGHHKTAIEIKALRQDVGEMEARFSDAQVGV